MKKIIFLITTIFLLNGINSNNFPKNNYNEVRKINNNNKYDEKDTNDILNAQIDEYNNLYNNCDDEYRKKQIKSLIDNLNKIKLDYNIDNERNDVSLLTNSVNNDLMLLYNRTVRDAIVWFLTSNYKLSAELLTHSYGLSEEDAKDIYYPVYSNKVYSSNVLYNILNENQYKGKGNFPVYSPFIFNETSRNEEDLGFSIHKFDYFRDSLKTRKIKITDVYNFDKEADTEIPVVDDLQRLFHEIEEAGIVKAYNIEIIVDLDNVLKLDVKNFENNNYYIDVTNIAPITRNVIFNKKLCNENDAINWTNLTDIDGITIKPKETKQIKIQQNGTSTHIALSFFETNERYITFTDEIEVGGHLNIELNIVKRHKYNNLELIGKDNNVWILSVKNESETRTLEYNKKMCNESDAIKWENLTDLSSKRTLAPYKEEIIRIYENYYATHIALRLYSSTKEQRYYINNLNSDTTMNVNYKTLNVYKYLEIEIDGKKDSTWKIMIKNPLSSPIEVFYNKKMCFVDEAKKWDLNKLKDISSVIVPGNGYKVVDIQENWFATHIALSYIADGHRLITYANNLNADGTIAITNVTI